MRGDLEGCEGGGGGYVVDYDVAAGLEGVGYAGEGASAGGGGGDDACLLVGMVSWFCSGGGGGGEAWVSTGGLKGEGCKEDVDNDEESTGS